MSSQYDDDDRGMLRKENEEKQKSLSRTIKVTFKNSLDLLYCLG